MKCLIGVVAVVLCCLVVCSNQMRLIEEDGARLVKISRTNYGLTGPEMMEKGMRCASINENKVTFWKKDSCEFEVKSMDDLSAVQTELIKIKGKIPKNRIMDHKKVGLGSTVTETRSQNHFIEIGAGSTVTLIDSNDNHITVGDKANLMVTDSHNNMIKLEDGQSATITNKLGQEIVNENFKPLEQALFGIKMEGTRLMSGPEGSDIKIIVELKDHVAFITKDNQIQMKPMECLDDSEKLMLKRL